MYNESSKKAVKKYCAKAYDEIKIRVKKGQKEQIQTYAESKGQSLNGFINGLIKNEMGTALTVNDPPEQNQN